MDQKSPTRGHCLAALAAVLAVMGGVVEGANVYVSSFGDDYAEARVFVDDAGRPLEAGSGFVAIGSFTTIDDAALATAAGNSAALAAALDDFAVLGDAGRFGGGFGLPGVVDFAATGPMLPGNPLLGRPIYLIGGNERGVFIYRTNEVFRADAPISYAEAIIPRAGAGRFILGSDGPLVTLEPFATAQSSVVLAGSATGESLDITRFESLVPVPPAPAEPADPGNPPSPPPSPPSPSDPPPDIGGPTAPVISVPDPPAAPRMEPPPPPLLPIDGGPLGPGDFIFVDDLRGIYTWTYDYFGSDGVIPLSSPGALAFSATMAVPEPSVAALAAAAMVLAARRRRRDRQGDRNAAA